MGNNQVTARSIVWGQFRLDGGSFFGVLPKAMWTKFVSPDEANRIPVILRSLLLETGGHKVLVDCGNWPLFPEKLRDKIYKLEQPPMEETLRAQTGLSPEEITDVIPSHLHFDHVGGFFHEVNGVPEVLFQNARLHTQKRQLEWALKPSSKDQASFTPALTRLVADVQKLAVHDGPWTLTPGIDVDVAHGHTPFMQTVRAETSFGPLVHAADVVPMRSQIPLAYIMAFDIEPLKTVEDKERLYQKNPGAIFYCGHDPENPLCRVVLDDRGRPMPEQVVKEGL